MVSSDTHPDRYVHWPLAVEGCVATLTLDVDEDRGPGYKLNSYNLGVDIELADGIARMRVEHRQGPNVFLRTHLRATFNWERV